MGHRAVGMPLPHDVVFTLGRRSEHLVYVHGDTVCTGSELLRLKIQARSPGAVSQVINLWTFPGFENLHVRTFQRMMEFIATGDIQDFPELMEADIECLSEMGSTFIVERLQPYLDAKIEENRVDESANVAGSEQEEVILGGRDEIEELTVENMSLVEDKERD